MKLECQKLRAYVRHCGRKRGKEAMTVAEEPSKHIKKLEDQIERLKKEVQACKQVRILFFLKYRGFIDFF